MICTAVHVPLFELTSAPYLQMKHFSGLISSHAELGRTHVVHAAILLHGEQKNLIMMECSRMSRQGSLQLERNGHGGESSSDFVDLSHAGVDFFATNDPEDETDVSFADIIGQFGDEYDKLTKMVQQKAVALKESESKSRSVQLELDGVRGELSIRTAERDALQTEVHRLRVELAKQCQNTGTSLVVCVPCMLIPGCRTSNARFTMGNFHPFHDTDLQPWWCASSEWRHRAVGVVRIAAVLQIHARLAPMLSTANPTIRWLPTMAHMQRCTTGPRRCRRRHLLPRWRHRAMNPSNGA
eukprot:m.1344933 g.1344933  ORF g.1344933 m.1344933 type:complete len:297 (+) comp24903_c1_seq24:1658-2548(+)